MLDICTTSLYDHKQFHLNLLNLRHDDELLAKILDNIYQVYESKSLIHILRAMLTKNRDKRPSIKALIHDDFVQQCLEKIHSDLILYTVNTKSKKNNHADMLPKEYSFVKLTSYINENQTNEPLVQMACTRLSEISSHDDFDLQIESNQNFLLKLFQTYSNNTSVQLTALHLLENSLCLSLAEKTIQFLHDHILERFFYTFLKFDHSLDIQLASVKIIVQLSNFKRISDQLAKYDVIKYLLSDLENFGSDANLCAYTCNAMW